MIQKMTSSVLLAFMLICTNFGMAQCVKGNWDRANIAKAEEAINSVRGDLKSSLGDQTQDYIDCYLERIINAYDNFSDADNDLDGCTKLAEKCMKDISKSPSSPGESKSKKGNWNQDDIDRANSEVDALRGELEEALGTSTDDFIECYLRKLEANYKNFSSANSDFKGCEKLAQKCMENL